MSDFLMDPLEVQPSPRDFCICVSGRMAYLSEGQRLPRRGSLTWPQGQILRQIPFGKIPGPEGSAADQSVWALEIAESEGPGWQELRELLPLLPVEKMTLFNRGYQLLLWEKRHAFCGICGQKTQRVEGQFARQCPTCQVPTYPRLNPAIITLIHRGDQILLARNPLHGSGVFSLIAGFVEIGETLEQTVVREAFEEVGVRVKNIRYVSSQSWPFPDTLMLGFFAEWESGEITPDGVEIAEAAWFDKAHFPPLPWNYSIARKLIRAFYQDETL